MSETSANPQPKEVPTKLSLTLEMEKTSQSLYGPSVYQVENGIDPQHDMEDSELPEPELQALDHEDATNKVEKKAVEDISDRESEKGIEYEERYHIKSLLERKEKSKLRLLQASHFLRYFLPCKQSDFGLLMSVLLDLWKIEWPFSNLRYLA